MDVTDPVLIIDFDSTFVQLETLDELAKIALEGHPDAAEVVEEIERITRMGMEGQMSFGEALRRRFHLIQANRKHLSSLITQLKRAVSPSILAHKAFLRHRAEKLYILSGGFHEVIWPVVKGFGIAPDHVLANRLHFDYQGNIVGCDFDHPLAHGGGKVEVVRRLGLNGDVVIVGDGYTDYQVREKGAATRFICFTESVYRQAVVDKADQVAHHFDDVLRLTGLAADALFPDGAPKALLLEGIHAEAVHFLESYGLEVETCSHALGEAELLEKVKEVSILGVRSKTRVTERVLEAAPQLLAAGAFCIGTKQLDLEACTRRGVAVFNAPFSNTRSVVELALGEIIMLERNIFDRSQAAHQGKWLKTAAGSHEVRGKRLGILGYGNIGSQLSIVAEAMGMHVSYYDVEEKLPLGNAHRCRTLEELLSGSDIVSIHVDDSPRNRNLIGAKELECMCNGALLLNLSRGFVVDLEALAAALQRGKLRGAAVDVFPVEPQGNHEALVTPLQGLPNVILTPHIGGSTLEAQRHIADFVSSRLCEYLTNGTTLNCVNLPNVQLPAIQKTHRLLHIHDNVPGVLAKISGCLANHGVNIEGQYLKTDERTGYVIIDVDAHYDPAVLEELKAIPATRRVRVLY